MVYWRIFGAWKKKNKYADVIWCRFYAISVCSLIDHDQQPMKMYTENVNVNTSLETLLCAQ